LGHWQVFDSIVRYNWVYLPYAFIADTNPFDFRIPISSSIVLLVEYAGCLERFGNARDFYKRSCFLFYLGAYSVLNIFGIPIVKLGLLFSRGTCTASFE
jgi:hypothetical protein